MKQNNFKKRVFDIVKKIPKGKVLNYKEVARLAGKPKAYRVVGNILNKNRNPKVPCHRVIKSNGEIGGYNRGIKKKIALLKKEGIIMKNYKLQNPRLRQDFGGQANSKKKSYGKTAS